MNTNYSPQNAAIIEDITPYSPDLAHVEAGYGGSISIGQLSEQWRQRQLANVIDVVKPAIHPQMPLDITYVQPLSRQANGLLFKLRATNIYIGFILVRFRAGVRKGAETFSMIFSVTWIKDHLPEIKLFPKKYTLAKGMVINMDTRTTDIVKKVAAPLIAAVAIVAVAVAIWQPAMPHLATPQHHAKVSSSNMQTAAPTASQTSVGSSNNSGQTVGMDPSNSWGTWAASSACPPSMAMVPAAAAPVPTSGSTVSTIVQDPGMVIDNPTGSTGDDGGASGGLGGGSDDTGGSSDDGSGSGDNSGSGTTTPGGPVTTDPNPVTLPGQTVDLGDTPVVTTPTVTVTQV